jgi:hypothetical protein
MNPIHDEIEKKNELSKQRQPQAQVPLEISCLMLQRISMKTTLLKRSPQTGFFFLPSFHFLKIEE